MVIVLLITASLAVPPSSARASQRTVTVVGAPGLDVRAHCSGRLLVRIKCDAQLCDEFTTDAGSSLPAQIKVPDINGTAALEAPGCWAAPVVLQRDVRAQLIVWPAGKVIGRVRATPKDQVGTIHLESTNDNVDLRTDCPITGDTFICSVPATVSLDLRFSLEGFLPEYAWGIRVAAHRSHDAHVLQFERGTMISGWVTAPDRMSHREATVTATRVSADPNPRHIVRQTARANARGFFEIRNVAEGKYRVVATAGHYTSAAVDVEAKESREIRTRVLALQPTRSVQIALIPPIGPNRERWQVSLRRAIPMTSAGILIDRSAATEAGTWSHDSLVAGEYWIQVEDSHGSRYERRAITVGDDAPSIVTIDIPVVEIRGRIRRGTEGVKSHLSFQKPKRAIGVRFDSDDSGYFTGVLPEDGKWNLRVETATSSVDNAEPINVQRREDGTASSVEIQLAAGRVRGRVIDESGSAAQATVLAFRNGRVVARAATAANGDFIIEGLDLEELEFSAQNAVGQSAAVRHDVIEEDEPPMTLTLRFAGSVRGHVLGTGFAPVAGALLRYETNHLSREIVTGPTGEFEIQLYDREPLAVAVLAPGLPTKMLLLSPTGDTNHDIFMNPAGGLLHISFQERKPSTTLPYVFHNGAAVRLDRLLFPFTAGPPDEFVDQGIQLSLEAGPYAICPAAASTAECAQTNVTLGSKTRVVLRGGA